MRTLLLALAIATTTGFAPMLDLDVRVVDHGKTQIRPMPRTAVKTLSRRHNMKKVRLGRAPKAVASGARASRRRGGPRPAPQ